MDSQSVKQEMSLDERQFLNEKFHHLRYVIAIMCGIATGGMYLLRQTVVVAILNMVNQTHLYIEDHPNVTLDDFLEAQDTSELGMMMNGEFNWTNEIQQTILACYMVTYTLPQVPMTQLCARMGNRIGMAWALMICTITTGLMYPFAYLGWQWLVGLRLLHGLAAAPVVSVAFAILEAWAPPQDRSMCLTLSQVMSSSIFAVAPFMAGVLSSIHWRWAFLVPCAFGCCLVVIWLLLITSRPEENRWISAHELELIQIGSNKQSKGEKDTPEPPNGKPSILDLLKHPTFYAIALIWALYCSAVNILGFILPLYLQQFLKVNISQIGFNNFLINLGIILASVWPHYLLRVLQSAGGANLSENWARKWSVSLAWLSSSLIFALIGLTHRHQLGLLFLCRLMSGSSDVLIMGSLLTIYGPSGASSTAYSMINTFGNIHTSFLSSLVGRILDQMGQSVECWSWIYYTLAATSILVVLLFISCVKTTPATLSRRT